jgi:tryptophanyl-tRNA synthetase
MTKPTVLTGLRANNDLHIGHYFGALMPMVDLAKDKAGKYQINLFVPDLHSFTTPIDHANLQGQIIHNIKLFVAAGLPIEDPDVHIYRQSYISAHSELTWILDCFTGIGEMRRMTQFKDKAAQLGEDRISVGLFNYPVLMASDILLYNAKYVPVGEDQTQHIEYTRDIAERINKKFDKELLIAPVPVAEQHKFFGKEQGLRIKDLADPTKKMSKSDETGKGVIFLSESPESARKKIMSATTDDKALISYDPVNQPGITNLIDILALVRGQSTEYLLGQFEGQTAYGSFKQVVADEVSAFLATFQKDLAGIQTADIEDKLLESERTVSLTANDTLLRVQKAVGLR